MKKKLLLCGIAVVICVCAAFIYYVQSVPSGNTLESREELLNNSISKGEGWSIDAGVIPKYAGCVNGVQWFKDRVQWLDNSAEPTPGMIIFFDWADESGQDGLSDHTGIVQKVENGRVYTVEGNSGDSVRQNSYPVGYYEILGYGAPAY